MIVGISMFFRDSDCDCLGGTNECYLRITNADIQACRITTKGGELKVTNPTRHKLLVPFFILLFKTCKITKKLYRYAFFYFILIFALKMAY